MVTGAGLAPGSGSQGRQRVWPSWASSRSDRHIGRHRDIGGREAARLRRHRGRGGVASHRAPCRAAGSAVELAPAVPPRHPRAACRGTPRRTRAAGGAHGDAFAGPQPSRCRPAATGRPARRARHSSGAGRRPPARWPGAAGGHARPPARAGHGTGRQGVEVGHAGGPWQALERTRQGQGGTAADDSSARCRRLSPRCLSLAWGAGPNAGFDQ